MGRKPDEPPKPGGLERLLELEQRLEARRAEADAEAARLIETARQASGEARRSLEEDLRTAEASLVERVRLETEAAVSAIRDGAARRAGAYRGLSEADAERWARWILERIRTELAEAPP